MKQSCCSPVDRSTIQQFVCFKFFFSVVNVNTSLTTGTDKCIKHLQSRVDSFLNTSGYVPQNKNYLTCYQCQGLISPVSYQSTEKIKIWGQIRVVNSINRHRIFIVQHPIIFIKFWILFVCFGIVLVLFTKRTTSLPKIKIWDIICRIHQVIASLFYCLNQTECKSKH